MRRNKLLVVPFIFILVLSVPSTAQNFGGTPPSQKWKQVNTDTARIIFPEGMDSSARRISSIVHLLARDKPASLGDKLRKINIVLQHQTTIANGYAGLGPFRSEFFMTPAMNNFSQGSISWADQLALHEYRHIQQFNNFRNGLSNAMYYLFGEEGLALAINASVPDWFYEGDAVYNETLVSSQGRGRLPLFLNTYPSLWQAGKEYSWMKLRNGSLKDYVPNHYNLGYLLVNYGREKYGKEFWGSVTRDASAFKGLVYPFQKAIRAHAGVDYKKFREEAFDSYKSKTERVSVSRDEFLFPVNKNYVTSYQFPYSIGNDSLLYLKSSYRHRPAFFVKDSNGERRIRVKDISIDDQFSYRNGKIVYAAYEPDPRWRWRDYSVIRLYDLKSGVHRTVTHKTKYFTPDISANGERIAAVYAGIDGKSELHILDAENGNVIRSIKSAEIMLFTDPKFIDDGNLVTAVRLTNGKMALARAEIETGNTVRLTTPSFNVLGYPAVYNGVVYFTASYGANDDVYALRLSDKKIARISDGPLGNYQVNVGDGKITWSAFTADGMQLKQLKENEIAWDKIPAINTEQLEVKFPVTPGDDILSSLTSADRPVTEYPKGTNLFNFHSWRPYYEDPIFTFSLYGENILNTFQTELYYLYNENERTSALGFNAIYGKWFPFLSLGAEYTFMRERAVGNRIQQWDQLDTRVGFNIPLNLTKGRNIRNLNFGSNYVYRRDLNKGFFKDSLGNTGFSYLHHFITWGQQVELAVQHIYPRLGYGLSLNHRHAITDLESWQMGGAAAVYLPGFMANHSLVVTGSFQETDTLVTAFGNRFSYSRGYNVPYFARMWRISGNYHFPLWHPDFGFANILYLKRIRANAFFDMTRVYSRDKTQSLDQRSVGGEIYLDTKWWNQYELTFGFRYSRLLDNDFITPRSAYFEFLVPISILPR